MIKRSTHSHKLVLRTLVVATVFFLMSTLAASAQIAGGGTTSTGIIPGEPANTCTDGPQFKTDIPDGGVSIPGVGSTGVFTTIAQYVKGLTSTLGKTLFTRIQNGTLFSNAIGGMLVLYVAFYGLFFATGHARANMHDFIIRCIKIAILGLLTSPNAWDFFNPYLSDFFNNATDDFMTQVANITIGGQQMGGENYFLSTPMQKIDEGLAKVISVNMGVHLLALLFSPPYGFFYLVLLVVALWAFLGLLLTGIWVYLTAIVFRGLLIGVAPIFIACILFTKTKHLFDGWLNQLISSCLQPILLFTFLSFFLLMILGAPGSGNQPGLIDQILETPVCWTGASRSLQGSPFNIHYWRFAVRKTGDIDSGTTAFEPYGGRWSWDGPIDSPGSNEPFPIPLIPLITFLVLAELGKRFGQMTLMIARELSASSVDISDMQNIFSGLLPSGTVGGAAATGKSATEAAATRETLSKEGASGAFMKNLSNSITNRLRPGSDS